MQVMAQSWRKCGAAFILIWVLLDLSVPGMCQKDDLESVPANVQTAASVRHGADASIHKTSTTPNDNGSDEPGPEDCFCCCSHVVPVSLFELRTQASTERYQELHVLNRPLDFSPFLYHPPKS
jgi:hypothetical protein